VLPPLRAAGYEVLLVVDLGSSSTTVPSPDPSFETDG
jgi:hypothetical protein